MVAIVFLNDIDNFAYRILMPEHIKEMFRDFAFEVPTFPGTNGGAQVIEKTSPNSTLDAQKRSSETLDAQKLSPEGFMREMQMTRVGNRELPRNFNLPKATIHFREPVSSGISVQKVLAIFSFYGTTPFIAVLCTSLVFGLHWSCC